VKNHLPLYSPWSPSKADLAARCPLAFKYRYVDKLKSGPKGTPAKVGTAAHLAQELVFKGDTVKIALDKAVAESKDPLTHKEEEQLRSFAQSLLDFEQKIKKFTARHPVKGVLLEKKWAITADFTPCDFFAEDGMIRGIIDMGLLLESEHLVIIDHKSGRQRPLKHYGTQLDIYAVLSHAHYPEVNGVQCAINFMAHDEVVWGAPKSVQYITKTLRPWLLGYLNSRAENVSDYTARTGRHCSWCDHRALCPEWVNDGKSGETST
jgi:putative RecB family exonuclease